MSALERTEFVNGVEFLLGESSGGTALWGRADDVLWAQGESLAIAAPVGVGKTSLAGGLLLGRCGITSDFLGYPVTPGRRTLYLACDRPSQIRRNLARLFRDVDPALVADRLCFQVGPPAADLARRPGALLELARAADADTVVIDSLKDVASGLSTDETGYSLNRSMQLCVSAGVEIVALHHLKKTQPGNSSLSLDLVHGSNFIVAGAGSVIALTGKAGATDLTLTQLKPVIEIVGPLNLFHDHGSGAITVESSQPKVAGSTGGLNDLDGRALRELLTAPRTINDLLNAVDDREPTDANKVDWRRRLGRLEKQGLVEVVKEPSRGGGKGGATGKTYGLTDKGRKAVDSATDNNRRPRIPVPAPAADVVIPTTAGAPAAMEPVATPASNRDAGSAGPLDSFSELELFELLTNANPTDDRRNMSETARPSVDPSPTDDRRAPYRGSARRSVGADTTTTDADPTTTDHPKSSRQVIHCDRCPEMLVEFPGGFSCVRHTKEVSQLAPADPEESLLYEPPWWCSECWGAIHRREDQNLCDGCLDACEVNVR